MKALYLSFLVILAGCANKVQNTDATKKPTDTINTEVEIDDCDEVDDDEESVGGHVCVSDDGKIAIESGIYPYGGTSPDYWAEWTILTDDGKKHTLRFDNSSYHDRVHAIHKNDGSTYYLVDCSAKTSSVFTDEWLEAYKIVGDTICEVNIIDGVSKADKYEFYISYDIPSWYFATNGEGYDWLMEYDPESKNLYVPLVDNNEIIDRYEVWHFNGDRFECIGHQQHKGLHDSLAKYNRLIKYFNTKDYIIRVDSLDSHELRFASWKRPKSISDKPDIVIKGGKRKVHYAAPDELKRCDDYQFTKGGFEFIVNYCETQFTSHGIGTHHDFFLIKMRDKVLIKQPKI